MGPDFASLFIIALNFRTLLPFRQAGWNPRPTGVPLKIHTDANLVPLQLALLLPSLTAPYVPLLTFGLVSLLGSALALALPETAGHQLPDSFAEVKHLV